MTVTSIPPINQNAHIRIMNAAQSESQAWWLFSDSLALPFLVDLC
jgi:hypothetical protein